jgi:hypothetical protein
MSVDDGESPMDPRLRRGLDELPNAIEPPRDLWPEIEARVTNSGSGHRPGRAGIAWAAVAALAAGLALFFVWESNPRTGAAGGAGEPRVAMAEGFDGAERANEVVESRSVGAEKALAVSRELVPGEGEYLAAFDVLGRAFDERRPVISSEATTVLDDSLGEVDLAIELSRGALVKNPDDAHLQGLLEGAYRHKIDLLEQIAELPETP